MPLNIKILRKAPLVFYIFKGPGPAERGPGVKNIMKNKAGRPGGARKEKI